MSRDDEGLETNGSEITQADVELPIEAVNPVDYRPPVRVPPTQPNPEEPAPTQQAPSASS